jgi:hypothetical protein
LSSLGQTLEQQIRADTELRDLLGSKWHPLAQDGKSKVPDAEVIQHLAFVCRSLVGGSRGHASVPLSVAPDGEVYFPLAVQVQYDDGSVRGERPNATIEWHVTPVPANKLFRSMDSLLGLATSLASVMRALGRANGMTEKQVAAIQLPLEKWVGRAIHDLTRKGLRGRKQRLAGHLTAVLRERLPHLNGSQAEQVAVRIAEIAGAEKPRLGEPGDRVERVERRRRRHRARASGQNAAKTR